MKELEAENTRLRRAVSDLTLDKMIPAPALAARAASQPRPAPPTALAESPTIN
jgi:hypothetical protein